MIQIFADGADIEEMQAMARNPLVKGFTTNPSLMRKAGVRSYEGFAKRALNSFPDYPISFEVFADDLPMMEVQAKEIASWGSNVFVKIPVCTTKGETTAPLIHDLALAGIKLNITAILCYKQIDEVMDHLTETPAIISIFAGRIADTGRDPAGMILHAMKRKFVISHEVLWASPRQVFDVYKADSLGCDIITVSYDILKKMKLEGKNLIDSSRETVKMFFDDAKAAGYSI